MSVSSIRVATLAAAACVAAPVAATPIDGLQLMRELNLIVLGDASTRHDVEGKSYVQGNLTGSGNYNIGGGGNQTASNRPVLTVGGDISGGWKNVQGGGTILAGGNVSQVNLNGGTYTVRAGGSITGNQNQNRFEANADVDIPMFGDTFSDLSLQLAALADTGGSTSLNGQTAVVNPAAGVNGVAVFNLGDVSQLLSGGGHIISSVAFGKDADLMDTIVMNVGGTSFSFDDNFLGGGNFATQDNIAENVIWNFYEATTLNFNREFFGSILAPLARVTNQNAINGTVVAKSAALNGEVHLGTYQGTQLTFSDPVPPPGGFIPPEESPSGEVPAPGALGLLALALIGSAAVRRRRSSETPVAA